MFSPVGSCRSHSLLPSPPVGRLSSWDYNLPDQVSPLSNNIQPYVEIVEQPASVDARFRYKCEGRSAGVIKGIHSTDKQKTYPTIKINGYQGAASVLVSCVTKNGPPYYPHPHNLVGKSCTNGVCYKLINDPSMICSFNLGIQCVKKIEITESLSQRRVLRIDPFGSNSSHNLDFNRINLNAVRLCFQVFLPDENGRLGVPLPAVISNPIFDSKTVSGLRISKLSHCSAPVTGGQEVILLCDQVNKDDIQVVFYEMNCDKDDWHAYGKFSPLHVHKRVAIAFKTPPYKDLNIQEAVDCFIQLQRPSDKAVGKPRIFTFLPLQKDPDGLLRKRNKSEALRLEQLLQPNNLPNIVNPVGVPRLIKQAVRSKVSFQSSPVNNFQQTFASSSNYQMQPSSSIQGNISYIPDINVTNRMSQKTDTPTMMTLCTQPCSSPQKVDDILALAEQQVEINSSHAFCDTPSDETLDKLSSLDLGIDPSELDVNLSGITLDSFSEPSGFNLSSSLMDVKTLPEKM